MGCLSALGRERNRVVMRRIEGHGYFVEWDSDGEGYARVVVKAAATVEEEVAERWLPQDQWPAYECRGEGAFEEALKAALDDIWPERAPHRIP